jgi:aminoglycoside/choline kinase family phosphotransferase
MQMEARAEIKNFVSDAGIQNADITLLAGDASFRKYWRVRTLKQTLVLMDAPPAHEDVRPFIQVTDLLKNAGLRVPKILAQDIAQGFLLLEDLGDHLFTLVLQKGLQDELALYEQACKALIHLQGYSAANPEISHSLPPYDDAVYLRELALFGQWFLPEIHGEAQAKKLSGEWQSLWADILAQAGLQQNCMVHRDYHADNLLWLDGAKGMARVGMLDYQDALCGDALYDAVSLLEDARRDVAGDTVQHCKNMLFDALCRSDGSVTKAMLETRYNVLAAQRNCKIIGIFMRLAMRDHKPRYLAYLPRVWQHLHRDLQHEALAPIRQFIEQNIPADFQGGCAIDAAINPKTKQAL